MQCRPPVCANNTQRCAAVCLAAALSGCASAAEAPAACGEHTGSAASAIQGGYPDRSDLAVTGLLILDRKGRMSRTCSGALIAPNLLLTAQHCLADAPKRIACKTA